MANKILVTGGAGYIGSHTAVNLIENNYEVIIVDNLSNSEEKIIDGIEKITGIRPEFYQFDLCDIKKTNNFFAKHTDIKAIIHFAAYKAVGESVSLPLKYYHNNIASLINILQNMTDFNIPNLVFSSSCTVYGQPEKLPVNENAPIQPANSPYGNTKQISEEMIKDTILSNKNINTIALRYFNPIGAHKSSIIGELPIGVPNNLIPFITQTVAGLRKELSVFGNDYNTPDGSAIRDYIHIEDLAEAHVIAITRLLEQKNKQNFEYFNLGTGQGNSVLDVINTFEKFTGKTVNYKIVPRREGDVEQVWADTSFANKELNWKAKTSLGNSLLSAWNWEKKLRGIH
jgi:UDP-glucose 4-epimerase